MFVDYHVHTEFSDDSIYDMEDVVKDAIKMGINEICFTDHVDYGIKYDWDCGHSIPYRNGEPFANVDYTKYISKIAQMKQIHQLIQSKKRRKKKKLIFLKCPMNKLLINLLRLDFQ